MSIANGSDVGVSPETSIRGDIDRLLSMSSSELNIGDVDGARL